jgi:hypothetical protein
MDIIKQRAPLLRAVMMRPANASAFAESKSACDIVFHLQLFVLSAAIPMQVGQGIQTFPAQLVDLRSHPPPEPPAVSVDKRDLETIDTLMHRICDPSVRSCLVTAPSVPAAPSAATAATAAGIAATVTATGSASAAWPIIKKGREELAAARRQYDHQGAKRHGDPPAPMVDLIGDIAE